MQQPPQMMMMMQQQQAPPQQPSLPVWTYQLNFWTVHFTRCCDQARRHLCKCTQKNIQIIFFRTCIIPMLINQETSAPCFTRTGVLSFGMAHALQQWMRLIIFSKTFCPVPRTPSLLWMRNLSVCEKIMFTNFVIASSLNNVAIYNILVSVNGLVEYGGDYRSKRYFTQYFVLHPELDNQQKMTLFIASDTFRWINPLPPMLAKPRGPKQFGGPQSSQYGQQPQQQQPQNMGRGQFVPDNQQFAPQGPVRGGFRGRSRGRGRGRGGRGRGNFNQGEGGAPPPQYN